MRSLDTALDVLGLLLAVFLCLAAFRGVLSWIG